MKVFLTFIFLLLFSLSPVYAKITVSDLDPGGDVETYLMFWKKVAAAGEQVVIDAPCMSACTFFLKYVPEDRVCITERGSLGIHMVSVNGTPQRDATIMFVRYIYPQWVLEYVKAHGGLGPEMMTLYPEDVKGHIKLCPGSQYSTIKDDELIKKQTVVPPRFLVVPK